MNLRTIFLVICFPWVFTAIGASDKQYDSLISFCSAPAWGTFLEIPTESLPIHSSQVGEQVLLLNKQYHLDERVTFIQNAIKILTNAGVEALSQIKFHINPSNERLLLHHIRVCRDGIWSDRISTSTYKVLQRGARLEQNLYDEDLCVVYLLDDIRMGDIIEYAFSIVEEESLFSSHYARILYLQGRESIQRIYHRIIGHPTQSLITKSFPDKIEPTITILSPSLQEWVWEALATEDCPDEVDQPIWYNPLSRVHITQYTHWGDVVQKEYPLYATSEGGPFFFDQAVENLVHSWQETTRDPGELITLALRFVQDEIRYQGLEEGKGACTPTEPLIVLHRRFGDCKDKTLLLHMLLKHMGIDSTPVLVHSSRGKNLPDALPNPSLLNHVILSVSCDKDQYWLDTTLTLQGGVFPNIFCPNYHWGLPLFQRSTNLIPFPQNNEDYVIDVNIEMVIQSLDQVAVTIHTTFAGRRADALRRELEEIGLKQLSEQRITGLKSEYRSVKILSPLAIIDDRDSDTLQQVEHYLVSTRARPGKKTLKIPSCVLDYLDSGLELDRSTPYALRYPLWIKESISIKNPLGHWECESDELHINNPSLLYFYRYYSSPDTIRIDRELRHPQDNVPIDLINDYLEAIDTIEYHDISAINLIP
jgi:hypothetical protein